MDKLFELGAVDVWLTPIVMKKNRLATKISVLVSSDKQVEAVNLIMKETSSIGVRINTVDRVEAGRKIIKVQTSHGEVKVKLAYFNDELINIAPEYEDCAKIAKEKDIPLNNIYEAAKAEAYDQLNSKSNIEIT